MAWDESGDEPIWIPDSVPGRDTVNVPTQDPSVGVDPWAILKSVPSVISGAVGSYTSFLNARDSAKFSVEDRKLGQLKTQAQIDLAKQQVSSQSITDQARIAAQTQIAARQFSQMPGLTYLFGGSESPGRTDWLMLGLTAAGVYFAWAALKEHA